MNLSLHDPLVITADYPSTLTTSLSYGHSTSLSTSPCGHYIASGLIDGLVIIVDTWTHNVASILRGHSKTILGLKWLYTNDGEDVGLVSWGKDWKMIHWTLNKEHKFQLLSENKFTGGIINVNPINNNGNLRFVVARSMGGLCLVKGGEIIELSVKDGVNNDGLPQCISSLCNDNYLIVGTSKGWLQIVDVNTCEIIKGVKICSGNIKGIDIVEQAQYLNDKIIYGSELCPISKMVVNASDRILRQYDIGTWNTNNNVENWDLNLEQKYQDVVNQVQWNQISFGPSGEYVCASTKSHGGSSHDIYVWETGMGSLVQILEGSQEELMDVDWCGRRCEIIASGQDTGTIYVWGIQIEPKWSALAPDFEEIEQNIDYDEQEDEFDFLGGADNEDGEMKIAGQIEDEDTFVDVINKESKDARGFDLISGVKIDIDFEREPFL